MISVSALRGANPAGRAIAAHADNQEPQGITFYSAACDLHGKRQARCSTHGLQ